ncbi:putative signal peptidase complex subunit 2-like protein, partial [Trifolium pratense]
VALNLNLDVASFSNSELKRWLPVTEYAIFIYLNIFRFVVELRLHQGSFTSTGLVVSSKLPRFSDLYTLTVESADPKSISANEPVHLTKSVTEWFTKDGVLVEGLFWKDVEALIAQYTKEPKKSK